MKNSLIIKGTEHRSYVTFKIPYYVLLQESGNKTFFIQGQSDSFPGLNKFEWNMLHLRITNTKRSYRSLMFNIPKTFEAFVSQYVKTHYPKWKDSDKIDRLERSYRVINKQGVKAIAVVNPDTGETIEKPCITIEELFSTIISDKIAEKIPDISEGCSSQMGFTLLLHEITHAQMFKPEEYLAYVLKRALEQRLPLNYEDAFNQFAQNIPEHCEHVAERKKDRNDTRCSCYKNYYAIIGKTGFKIR